MLGLGEEDPGFSNKEFNNFVFTEQFYVNGATMGHLKSTELLQLKVLKYFVRNCLSVALWMFV